MRRWVPVDLPTRCGATTATAPAHWQSPCSSPWRGRKVSVAPAAVRAGGARGGGRYRGPIARSVLPVPPPARPSCSRARPGRWARSGTCPLSRVAGVWRVARAQERRSWTGTPATGWNGMWRGRAALRAGPGAMRRRRSVVRQIVEPRRRAAPGLCFNLAPVPARAGARCSGRPPPRERWRDRPAVSTPACSRAGNPARAAAGSP